VKIQKSNTRRPKASRRARRIALCVVLAVPAALAYAGCSSSSNNGLGTVPPGGTFGAVVTVHIEGGGRIYSEPAGIDCPGSCAHSFIFDQGTEGAAAGVKLTAEGAATWKFNGYTFNNISVASRGEGPSECQPISHATASAPPGADPTSPVVVLPPAEASGTSAAEGGAVCSAYTRVPVAYDLTATFNSTMPITDSGVDSGTVDGGDAGIPDMLYDRPPTASSPVGKRIFYSGSYLLWQIDDFGLSSIYYGNTSGTLRQSVTSNTNLITKFWATSGGAAYQSGGTLYGLWSPYSSATFLSGATTCNAVSADSTYAYCIGSNGTFTRWYRFTATSPQQLDSNLFNVASMDNDTTQTNVYYTDTSNVSSISATGADGGMPAADAGLVAIAQFRSSPKEVRYSSSTGQVYWTEFGDEIYSAPATGGGIVNSIGGIHTGLSTFAIDPFGTYIVAAIVPSTLTGASSIVRIGLPGGSTTTVRSNLTGVGGVATDGTYAYWTDSSGRVFKALVF
jgi:hypothetical protein